MPDMSELKPEVRAELEEFGEHLREHYEVAQPDCRFCLLRLSRKPAPSSPPSHAP